MSWNLRRFPLLIGLLLGLLIPAAHSAEDALGPAPGAIWVLTIDGAIGPATSDYVLRSFEKAAANQARLIVIEMNTPGGLDDSMRDIIQAILSSPIPVATYVSPQGSRAASAGTYILYASHIAAMAPATNLGAATPVQITPAMPEPPAQPGQEEKQPAPAGGTAMEKKMINDATAYIRGLAELRGRNADWAEEAVREAKSLSSSDALEQRVIDLVAKDLDDLIQQIQGQMVSLENDEYTLDVAGAPFYRHEPDWRTELLTTLTNPNLVLILGMIGIYGVILEFYNPGSGIPGTIGVICLLLAGYSLQLLPVNYAGLAFVILGIGLMVAEAMVPSFGIFGIGGIISFTIGGIILFDTDIEAFQVGTPAIAATAIVAALLIIATIQIALKVSRQRVTTGVETIVGHLGEAMSDFEEEGMVRVGGEIWRAKSDAPLCKGQKVIVTEVHGLELAVSIDIESHQQADLQG